MPKVLIADDLSPDAARIFRDRGIEVDVRPGLPAAGLLEIVGGYDGLAIRSATKVTEAVLAAGAALRVIGRAGIGVDNVDVAAATARGVVVMNTPHGNAATTAEHAIAMMMALARQIPQASASTRAGLWEKQRFMGTELTGKVLGVIGAGNIGAIVADRARGLHMRVVACDPQLDDARARAIGVEAVGLEALLAQADFITLHTPLNEGTRDILSASALAHCRRGVRIVNCARGGLIDEAALAEAIVSGQVGGAALDVFATEPARHSPLFGLEAVVCTPHLGASTHEAQERVALQVAGQMSDFLLTGAVSNAVNVAGVSAADASRLQPLLRLARWLGACAGQLAAGGTMRRVEIGAAGSVAAAGLAGVMGAVQEGVNAVSAPVVARGRGIEVRETGPDDAAVVRIAVVTEGGCHAVAGRVGGDGAAVLTEIAGARLAAGMSPHMLWVTGRDGSALVASVGEALARAGVEITGISLGRAGDGAAVCVASVDGAVGAAGLDALRGVGAVAQAGALVFE